MKKSALVFISIVALSACNSTMNSSVGMATSGPVMPSAIATPDSSHRNQFHNATALGYHEVLPSAESRHVTLHSHARLSSVPACSRIISLGFSSSHAYQRTMVGLKNRAALLGANAIGITNYIESGSNTYMVGHFYHCNSKQLL